MAAGHQHLAIGQERAYDHWQGETDADARLPHEIAPLCAALMGCFFNLSQPQVSTRLPTLLAALPEVQEVIMNWTERPIARPQHKTRRANLVLRLAAGVEHEVLRSDIAAMSPSKL